MTSLLCKIVRGFPHHARCYSTGMEHPLRRTVNVIKEDIAVLFGKERKITYPRHADIVIIGGGIIGSSIAFWLKKRAGRGLNVVVIEKDLSFKEAKKNLTLGRLTQHFSLPENIHLSQYTAEFIRNIKDHFEDGSISVKYDPIGHLVLASENYAERLEHNVRVQQEMGVRNELLTPETIKKRYPWINTDDVKLGSIGTEAEGLINTWDLLKNLVQKSITLGAIYVEADVIGFKFEKQQDVLMEGVSPGSYERMSEVVYKTADNEEHSVKFAGCVLAAGSASKEISRMAYIGTGKDMLSIPLATEKRKYKVYTLGSDDIRLSLGSPYITDTSGLWFQRNGLHKELICGHTPLTNKDGDQSNNEYFEKIIRPALENRLPGLSNLEIKDVQTEYFDYNMFDDSGILGNHAYYNNMYLASGFGTLGYQHAPGIGRAISELIIDSHFTSIDLTRFGFDRFLMAEPLIEYNVY